MAAAINTVTIRIAAARASADRFEFGIDDLNENGTENLCCLAITARISQADI